MKTEKMTIKDALEILEISNNNFDLKTIKKKHHQLSLKNHPDRQKTEKEKVAANEKQTKINLAREILEEEIKNSENNSKNNKDEQSSFESRREFFGKFSLSFLVVFFLIASSNLCSDSFRNFLKKNKSLFYENQTNLLKLIIAILKLISLIIFYKPSMPFISGIIVAVLFYYLLLTIFFSLQEKKIGIYS